MLRKLILLYVLVGFISTKILAQDQVEISGQLKQQEITPVKLFKTVRGMLVEISRYTPNSDGKFFMGFYPEYEGIYVLGTGDPQQRIGKNKFYFKRGDKLTLTLTDSTYFLTGDHNSKENRIMEQWQQLSNSLYQKSSNMMRAAGKYKTSTFVDFFPELEEVEKKGTELLQKQKTGNQHFDLLMSESMKWDLALYAATFNLMPHTLHPAKEEFTSFYDKLNIGEYTKSTTTVYRQPWSFLTLNNIQIMNGLRHNFKATSRLSVLENTLSSISNDTLRGDFVLQYAKGLKSLKEFQELFDSYGKYIITPIQKNEKNWLSAPYTKEQGSKAFNFSLPDQNGKTVTMESLKGKVVLIDFWATWCAPCLYEIPFMQKLEKELEGTDFVIVGISIDEDKNKEKWLKMLKEKNIGGIQLFASGFGEVAQFYQVTTIPRYMVIDRNGKIVTTSSPRPSNPELKALLEKTLATK